MSKVLLAVLWARCLTDFEDSNHNLGRPIQILRMCILAVDEARNCLNLFIDPIAPTPKLLTKLLTKVLTMELTPTRFHEDQCQFLPSTSLQKWYLPTKSSNIQLHGITSSVHQIYSS
jgi:hypothetical protein